MFHFKRFSIDDSASAMKIGTDSVLLGACTPCANESRILDIGAGSGILALMMAQRNYGITVDAVEIDTLAGAQARENAILSPWSEQINIFCKSIQDFSTETSHRYSLIISNPPYFINSLKAHGKQRNLARHTDSLPVTELLHITSKLLTINGKASFIFPSSSYDLWIQEAAKASLYPLQITWVKSMPTMAPHRAMVLFMKENAPDFNTQEMNIYSSRSLYSDIYKELTKDFYLNF